MKHLILLPVLLAACCPDVPCPPPVICPICDTTSKDSLQALLTDSRVQFAGLTARYYVAKDSLLMANVELANVKDQLEDCLLQECPECPPPVICPGCPCDTIPEPEPQFLGFGAKVNLGNPRTLKVTSLSGNTGNETTGEGSFLWCLNRPYARILTFTVGGEIILTGKTDITSPQLWIQGQTAPTPLTIRHYPLRIFTHDVIIQHLRLRIDNQDLSDNWDGLCIYRGSNIVIDHCSISGALDEDVPISSAYLKRVTISNCIISDAKYGSLNYTGDSVSYLRNLFINLDGRCPMVNNTGNHVKIANNLLYNTARTNSHIYYNTNSVALLSDCIGNVLIRGQQSAALKIIQVKSDMHAGTKIYLKDNVDTGLTSDPWSVVTGEKVLFRSDTPLINDGYFPMSSDQVKDHIKNNVGARPLDAYDQNLIISIK